MFEIDHADTHKRILIATGPNTENLQHLLNNLKPHCQIQNAQSTQELLHKVKAWLPHLILLDEELSDLGPKDIIRRIHESAAQNERGSRWEHIITAMITKNIAPEYIAAILDAGAEEVFTQPMHPTFTAAKVRSLLRYRSLYDQLRRTTNKLHELTTHDELTGLLKMKEIKNRLALEVERAQSLKSSLSCIMVDIDHLKEIIERHSHDMAGIIISQVGLLLKASTRGVDICGHHGGDEFVLILPETSLEGAKIVANRLKTAIEMNSFGEEKKKLKITTCFGISSIDHVFKDEATSLLKRAERALTTAKRQGPGTVAVDE